MAGLIVGLAVMAVLMTAAMPVWKHTVQREKEEELVFRGEQYRARHRHVSTEDGERLSADARHPRSAEISSHEVPRPIANDDFVPLTQASQAAQGGAQPAQAQQGRGGAATPGAAAPQAGVPAGGIIGVTSKSTDESIRLYKGRSHYNEWAFIYTPPAQAAGAGGGGGATAPGAGVGGRGGQGQAPQRGQPPGGAGGFPNRGGRSFQSGAAGPGRAGIFQPAQQGQSGQPRGTGR